MNCPNCNAEISDSVKFCPECGCKIDRKRYCPNCGTEVEANMKFCPECGTPISAPSTTTNKDNNYNFVGTTENIDSALYNKPFKMVVDDVDIIQDRGVILCGKIATGRIHVGDTVLIADEDKHAVVCNVLGIEMFRKLLDEGEAGDNCGILLDCLNPDYFSREDIMLRIDEMSEDEYDSYQICSIDDENYDEEIAIKEDDANMSDETKEALSDSKYADSFSEDSFWDKVKNVAKKAGSKVIREALLLWYVLQSPDVPWTQKSAIIAALGYFISPIDIIPDFIPVAGYSDDLAALIGVHEMVKASITPKIEAQADAKLREWFG